MRTLTVELPEGIVQKLGSTLQEATRHLVELAFVELFRQGELSEGKAADLLDLNRVEWRDLLARHDVPHTVVTRESLEHDLKTLADRAPSLRTKVE